MLLDVNMESKCKFVDAGGKLDKFNRQIDLNMQTIDSKPESNTLSIKSLITSVVIG